MLAIFDFVVFLITSGDNLGRLSAVLDFWGGQATLQTVVIKQGGCNMKLNNAIAINGADISYHQGAVDFVKLKQMGIKFVIIRAGYGETQDKMFTAYINAAIMVGLAVGVYWFIYAKDNEGARKNAEKFTQIIKPYKDKITCGAWADWEYDSDKRAGLLTVEQRSNLVDTFCQTMTDYGYEVGVYANKDYIQSKFTAELIARYPLWYARYGKEMGAEAYKGKNGKPYMWQYSSKGNGRDYGVSSDYIDLDYAYFDIAGNSAVDISIDHNPFIEPVSNVKIGKTGNDAMWVQWYLWRFGLLQKDEIDGVIGKKSDAGIREAQRRLGLAVDGIVGKASRALWKKIC